MMDNKKLSIIYTSLLCGRALIMRIGIDIDGVLNNLQEYHMAFGTRFCYDHNLLFTFHPEEYSVRDMFEWDPETEKKFYEAYYAIFLTSPEFIKTHAKDALRLLHRQNILYIITARLEEDVPLSMNQSMYDITKEWLDKNELCYDHLLFGEANKLKLIEQFRLDIMIEDNPVLLKKSGDSKIPFLCFDASYNRIALPENVMRVHSWYEALILLNQNYNLLR